MSFGAPKRKPGESSLSSRKPSSSSLRASSSFSHATTTASSASPSLRNPFVAKSTSSSPNNKHFTAATSSTAAKRRHSLMSKSTTSSQQQSRNQSPSQNHHKNTNNMNNASLSSSLISPKNSNYHMFLLRGEKYSMASDLFGFTDQMEPNPFAFIEEEREGEDEDPVSSPIRNLLARLENGEVPNTSQLSPETYDALAVMERMNHTRRMLESMQVERKECLAHIEKGKEIYRSVFARPISNKVADEMLGLGAATTSSSSPESSPSPPKSSKKSKKHNNSNNLQQFIQEEEYDDFELRHAKGEPKLQTPEATKRKYGGARRNSPINNLSFDSNHSNSGAAAFLVAAEPLSGQPSLSLNLSDSFTASLMNATGKNNNNPTSTRQQQTPKKETVFDRLSRTPPPPSWIAEASLASKKVIPVHFVKGRKSSSTPKRNSVFSTAGRKRRDFGDDEHGETDEKISATDLNLYYKRMFADDAKNTKKDKKDKKKRNKKEQDADEDDDVDAIPTRFKESSATREYSHHREEDENENENYYDTPQIIRTPLPDNAYDENQQQNYFISPSGNGNRDVNNNDNNFYTIEYTSPARLPIGRLQAAATQKQNQISVTSSSSSSLSMMPQIYRMQDPATNFGDNLEWTSGVNWE